MENKAYLASVGVTPSHENYARCLGIMDHYGENRWWLSEDPKTRAYYQTEELVKNDILLLPDLLSYQTDLFILLQRPVSSIEIINTHKLLEEAQVAMIDQLTAQGRVSEAEALRQRMLQETINPKIETAREHIEKRGGIFFMSEETKKDLGRQ